MNLFNTLKIIFVSAVFSIGLQANVVWGKSVKTTVVQFAHAQYQQIMTNNELTSQQRLYQASMPLLALATLQERDGYQKISSTMELIFKDNSQLSQIEKPWQLWMLGRMAIASKLMGDKARLAEIRETLSLQLFENDNKDVMTGWAFAYLAAVDKHSYKACREKLFEYTGFARNSYDGSPTTEASNFVWTLVMNLYASANAKNKKDYHYFLQELKMLSEKNSLNDTALLVPMDDYRQWLISLARYSFMMMKDKNSLKELKGINKPEVDNMDSMLAWANELAMKKG